MLTGNKGEWSEIYALFKLLGDTQIFAGDPDLKKIEDLFYPIIKIIRNERGKNFEYELNGDIVIIAGKNGILRIPVEKFKTQASALLSKIKEAKGAFSIPDTESFMKEVSCNSIKAKSSLKTDIRIVIHDIKINQSSELGFSIKSQLGSEATLLNAGKTTNFVYSIKDLSLSKSQIDKINKIESKSKIKERVEEIKKLGGELIFENLELPIFANNLVLIDSLLPNILAEIVKIFFSSPFNSIEELTNVIKINNPSGYDTKQSHPFYEYKIKRFLTDVALGMTPSKVWQGIYDASGGYLIVKENGEVLCYHIYNRNQFEDYLFKNTKLETASSSKHDFGKIYKEGKNIFFKLNLQIRFKN